MIGHNTDGMMQVKAFCAEPNRLGVSRESERERAGQRAKAFL